MKITIENIGVFRFAQYELADLTIVCGKNNTGKTYATYALYGFFDFFRRGYTIAVSNKEINLLLENGSLSIELNRSIDNLNKYLKDACAKYKKYLPKIFAAQEKYFIDAKFGFQIDSDDIIEQKKTPYEYSYQTSKKDFLQISESEDGNILRINLLSKGNDTDENSAIRLSLSRIIGDTIKEILFHDLIPECFIASAERTGAVIFKEELNFEKNSILREVATSEEIRIENIVDKIYNTSYALPVRRNIDFIRNLESISKEDGMLYKEHPEIIEYLNSMVGGEYKISKEGIYYAPSKNIKLSIGESASSIRSLLDIYFYLRYVARKGHMLMIDEPEMNLHPSYQRLYARILAMLVNFGVKIFITTHSDYIVKEFNTLLMLNSKKEKESIKKLIIAYNYCEQQFLDASKVKMFISEVNNILLPGNKRKTKTQTLSQIEVTPNFGFSAYSFDDTINEMNNIQETLYFA